MIDKDLTNIDMLKLYYPNTKIFLCTFHVLKWFKKLVNDHVKKDDKETVHNLLRDMTYANNQEQFDNANKSLCEYANTYPKLIEQINNNWMLNQEDHLIIW